MGPSKLQLVSNYGVWYTELNAAVFMAVTQTLMEWDDMYVHAP